ncbi:probable acyl-[acyl-carrier-protein]--UDP-N-acetylglucosamine O-acyltransferase, mitochondrial isoform X1 [Tanacetum coccineum]
MLAAKKATVTPIDVEPMKTSGSSPMETVYKCLWSYRFIKKLRIIIYEVDGWLWKLDKKGMLTVKRIPSLLDDGILVGPFCTVGPSAVLGNNCKLHPRSHVYGNTELGDKCILMSRAIVGDNLPEKMIIGCNNVIGHHAVVICFLEVGDNNEIREHVSIHRSSKPCDRTVIGDNNLIIGSCHIAHDCKVGSNNIFANNTLLAGHVLVEAPWTNERPLESRELNAFIGAWFTLWRD